MVWAAISWNSLDPIVALHGTINSKDYIDILRDRVHPMVQALFPEGVSIFHEDNASIQLAHVVKSWHAEHGSEPEA